MSKRFIDTNLFDDAWFMDLSASGKLLWIYFITKCNHAGIIEINIKLATVQTGIKNIETTIKQLASRLITVKENIYFIPKYIDFQYPNFPNSKVRQQYSAIEILKKYNLFDEEKLTVNKPFVKGYDNESGNGNGNGNGNEPEVKEEKLPFDQFWDSYNKKVGDKTKLEKKWDALSLKDQHAIMEYVPKYIASQPDKKYRKNAESFLNNKSWNDELIQRNSTEVGVVIGNKENFKYES